MYKLTLIDSNKTSSFVRLIMADKEDGSLLFFEATYIKKSCFNPAYVMEFNNTDDYEQKCYLLNQLTNTDEWSYWAALGSLEGILIECNKLPHFKKQAG